MNYANYFVNTKVPVVRGIIFVCIYLKLSIVQFVVFLFSPITSILEAATVLSLVPG